ncbi:nitrogenase [Vallitalea pronyensis]|uniref:Nitrogenase n=1 Tax=Vallitalea pronyensis TaxID=1348613 RepID=A0A8J8SHB9_9FIRM|nr:nitrogenase component 1 [Vallitalea pronyensis]QUI23710.1 nitrogenase [Vallitalea pronyensis]
MCHSENRNFTNLHVNPCKMCMPMGASLVFKGIENSMVLIHGSQGCSTYIRRHIATHYNEPIDIASSSLSEQGTVYGGASNLVEGLKNVVNIYEPEIIGVLTTCLAETIGEDTHHMIQSSGLMDRYDGIDFVSVKTPGYGASQYRGYLAAVKSLVAHYARPSGVKTERLNVIVSDMSPRDVRELKRMLNLFQVDYIMLPDISDTLDASFDAQYKKIPKGGTKRKDIMDMANSKATIELGMLTDDHLSAGKYLEDHYQVPHYKCPIPIGLEGTDTLLQLVGRLYNKKIPRLLLEERGRILDAMIDSHKWNREGKAVIFGTPELVYGVTNLCIENGIEPQVIATGSDHNHLSEVLQDKLEAFHYHPVIIEDTDFETIGKLTQQAQANLLIGHSDGKFLKEQLGIPLIRIGFPIHDHVGGQRKLYIGYEGSLRFLDEITNTLLDLKHDAYRENMYATFYGPHSEMAR